MVRIDRIEGAAAYVLLQWIFGESSPAVGAWYHRLQAANDDRMARVLLYRVASSKETAAGFLFYQSTPNGPAHLLEWRVSDAWKAIDPTLSFRSVADQAIDAGARWVQWNRIEKMAGMPEDSWWQPDLIGDLVHWEKQLRGIDALAEECSGSDTQRPVDFGGWQMLWLEAKELTAYLSDYVGTMQQHLDFPELDHQIDPKEWIAQQLADCETSWAMLAMDTSRSPQEVGGLVLWNLDSKMGWEMRWLGVKPRWRGSGLASHLVQQSMELLAQQRSVSGDPLNGSQRACGDWEASGFWVSCDSRNRPMIGLLEKLKFFPVYRSSLLFWWRAPPTSHE